MCAVIKRGILGGVQNKIGNVVGSSWKGIATLRSLPLSVANPKTAAQTSVRTKFSDASKAASTLLATIIKPLWDRFAQQQSGYNAWIQANVDFFNGSGGATFDTFVMSKGALAISPILSSAIGLTSGDFVMTWNPTPGGDANASDTAYITLIDVDGDGNVVYTGYDTQVARSVGTFTVAYDLSDTSHTLYSYLSFRKSDGTKVSDSAYSIVTEDL